MAKLRGLAWDHMRCWGPLDASVAPYRADPGLDIAWDRHLYEFGEGAIDPVPLSTTWSFSIIRSYRVAAA